MLKELAKKDRTWRLVSLKICKNKDLADEIVNRMYLRLYDRNPSKEKLTDYYVITTIRNLFLDYCKEKRKQHQSIEDVFDVKIKRSKGDFSRSSIMDYSDILEDNQTDKTLNDEELSLLIKANQNLKWWEKQLLVESYDKSLKMIEKEFNINYMFVYNNVHRIRKVILGDDPKYSNCLKKKSNRSNKVTDKTKDKRTKEYKNGKQSA